jgi:hypothetical protein
MTVLVERILAALGRAGQACDAPMGRRNESQAIEATRQEIIAVLNDPPPYHNTPDGQLQFLKFLRQKVSAASDIVKAVKPAPQ